MALVGQFGEMWARNNTNIKLIPQSKNEGQGVYILYDGSMPVYVGKGNMRSRIRTSMRSPHRGQFWDHFSWYAIPDLGLQHDVEALFLRTLPWYLRALTRQSGKFTEKKKSKPQKDYKPEPIRRRRSKPSPK